MTCMKYAIGFVKSHCQMKFKTIDITQFTITDKFTASHTFCPSLTSKKKFFSVTFMPIFFFDEYPF